jgi:hypothetical protein
VVLEMLLGIGLVVAALMALGVAAWRRTARPTDWLLAGCFGPLALLVPLVYGTSQSQYRAHTLLLPLVLLLRHLPAPVAGAFAVLGTPVLYQLTILYLTGDLI